MLHNIYLTDTELDAQVKIITQFLLSVHPELNNKTSQTTCVELRPINRSADSFNIRLSRSLNLWRLDDRSLDLLRDYLNKHNGEPYCMYYSVFAYDYNKDAQTKAGSKAKKGKITADAAMFANELAFDFDGISYVDFEGIERELASIGLEGLWVFTGHGYQLHLLLDEPLYDERMLFRMVYLFRSKGLMCDTSCVDSARLMRLPFTYNCKCFSNETYDEEYNNPPLCRVIKETAKRYSVHDIAERVSTLETISEYDETIYFDSLKEPVLSEGSNAEGDGLSSSDFVLTKVEYPEFLTSRELPAPILAMLQNTPHGVRNSVLGTLIRYFKQFLLLGKAEAWQVLTTWAEYACQPAYHKSDFVKDFERLYHIGGMPYSSELAKKFGYIDFDGQIQLHRDNKVLISNRVFQNLASIDGNALRAYLAVKILEHGNTSDEDVPAVKITIDAIADVSGMSIPTLKRVLPAAKKAKLLYVETGAKRKGEPNVYRCNQINDSEAGFKALSVNDLEVYLSASPRLKVSNTELKLYLFMLYKFYTKDRAMSLKKLGEFIGRSEATVSEVIMSLRKKRYLKVERVYKDNVIFYNKYTLLK